MSAQQENSADVAERTNTTQASLPSSSTSLVQPDATETTPLISSSAMASASPTARRPGLVGSKIGGANSVWQDIQHHRKAYWLTVVASFGGMLFG